MSIQEKYRKLKVLIHPGHENRGIAKSRNLGIKEATTEWIAFLDSDDYYLPNRFDKVEIILATDTDVDGVYEPVVNKVISQEGKKRFRKEENAQDGSIIQIVKSSRTPFESMFFGKGGGAVHLNGLTLRRSLAEAVGLFDEDMKIVEDSVFRLKVAYKGRLVRGSEVPVAVRSIHDTNNEPNIKPLDHLKKYESLLRYFDRWGATLRVRRHVIRKILSRNHKYKKSLNGRANKWISVLVYVCQHPKTIFLYLF